MTVERLKMLVYKQKWEFVISTADICEWCKTWGGYTCSLGKWSRCIFEKWRIDESFFFLRFFFRPRGHFRFFTFWSRDKEMIWNKENCEWNWRKTYFRVEYLNHRSSPTSNKEECQKVVHCWCTTRCPKKKLKGVWIFPGTFIPVQILPPRD